jgi:hypothetical protein
VLDRSVEQDADGDGMLDFDEFCALVRSQFKFGEEGGRSSDRKVAPSRVMMGDWFGLIDADNDGQVSKSEYFAFSLRETLRRCTRDAEHQKHEKSSPRRQSVLGTSMKMDDDADLDGIFAEFFAMWDDDGDGTMSVAEITKAAGALGFEAVTSELLQACDRTPDGSIKCEDFAHALQVKTHGDGARQRSFMDFATHVAKHPTTVAPGAAVGASDRLKRSFSKVTLENKLAKTNVKPKFDKRSQLVLLAALAKLEKLDEAASKDPFFDPASDTPLAKLRAEQIERTLAVLRSWIRKNGFSALDLFQDWDASDNLELSRNEVRDGFARLDILLSRTMLTHLFDRMATGFHLTYDELKLWLETMSSWEIEEHRRSAAGITLGKWARGFLARRQMRDKRNESDAPDGAMDGA